MLVEGIGLGLIITLLFKGNLKNIEKLTFKLWYLIVCAGILEFIFNIIRSREIEPLWQILDQHVFWLKVMIYGLIVISLVANIRLPGIIFALTGTIMNGIVVLLNGGRMPVSIDGVEHLVSNEYVSILESGKDLAHGLMTDETRFSFLGDIIHLRPPYPMPKSISVGDLFLCLGVMIFIYGVLKNKRTNIGHE